MFQFLSEKWLKFYKALFEFSTSPEIKSEPLLEHSLYFEQNGKILNRFVANDVDGTLTHLYSKVLQRILAIPRFHPHENEFNSFLKRLEQTENPRPIAFEMFKRIAEIGLSTREYFEVCVDGGNEAYKERFPHADLYIEKTREQHRLPGLVSGSLEEAVFVFGLRLGITSYCCAGSKPILQNESFRGVQNLLIGPEKISATEELILKNNCLPVYSIVDDDFPSDKDWIIAAGHEPVVLLESKGTELQKIERDFPGLIKAYVPEAKYDLLKVPKIFLLADRSFILASTVSLEDYIQAQVYGIQARKLAEDLSSQDFFDLSKCARFSEFADRHLALLGKGFSRYLTDIDRFLAFAKFYEEAVRKHGIITSHQYLTKHSPEYNAEEKHLQIFKQLQTQLSV